jgi:hypothetical protein
MNKVGSRILLKWFRNHPLIGHVIAYGRKKNCKNKYKEKMNSNVTSM